MDDTAVEQNLGRVRDAVERLQCLVELVVVVAGEGCHPGFDFLPRHQQLTRTEGALERRGKARTCFRDMTSVLFTSYPAVWCRQASVSDCPTPRFGRGSVPVQRVQDGILPFSSADYNAAAGAI